MAEIKPRLTAYEGPANVIFSVPALSPETFHARSATEEREIVEATISAVQARRKAEQLEAQFNMTIGGDQ